MLDGGKKRLFQRRTVIDPVNQIRIHTVSYNFKSNKVSPLAFNARTLISFPFFRNTITVAESSLYPPPTITGKLFPNEPFGWDAY